MSQFLPQKIFFYLFRIKVHTPITYEHFLKVGYTSDLELRKTQIQRDVKKIKTQELTKQNSQQPQSQKSISPYHNNNLILQNIEDVLAQRKERLMNKKNQNDIQADVEVEVDVVNVKVVSNSQYEKEFHKNMRKFYPHLKLELQLQVQETQQHQNSYIVSKTEYYYDNVKIIEEFNKIESYDIVEEMKNLKKQHHRLKILCIVSTSLAFISSGLVVCLVTTNQ